MATETTTAYRDDEPIEHASNLRNGGSLMALGGLGFVGYGIAFLARAFSGSGFEIGVATLGGMTKADLGAVNAAIVPYLTHVHVALAAFIISTGIAVTALSWYGVRRGMRWAWGTAILAPVVALALAIPLHYAGGFDYNSLMHLGPIYLSTIVFVVGALLAYRGMRRETDVR